jgi:hypothetical protein
MHTLILPNAFLRHFFISNMSMKKSNVYVTFSIIGNNVCAAQSGRSKIINNHERYKRAHYHFKFALLLKHSSQACAR